MLKGLARVGFVLFSGVAERGVRAPDSSHESAYSLYRAGSKRSFPASFNSELFFPQGANFATALLVLLIDSAGEESAVHGQHMACDEAGRVGSEKYGGASQFLEIAESSHRRSH
jgi:hypothetical protein